MRKTTEDMGSKIILYADGACSGNPGPGGWGVMLRDISTCRTREMSGGEKRTTNNRMELTAVICGLEAIKEPSTVTVVTDSQYVVKGMTEWIDNWMAREWKTSNKKPVKNVELWQRLLEVSRKHKVSWEWTVGHAGHPENERCDQLAVRAAAKQA